MALANEDLLAIIKLLYIKLKPAGRCLTSPGIKAGATGSRLTSLEIKAGGLGYKAGNMDYAIKNVPCLI
ncbi:MAG: hypothetical protein K2K35_11240 [Lachnospiraceae bacterium]|nr:hypothetical protein [Lachnospiraceae bacterium]